jgi:prephenate dehydrogenase
MTVGVVGVGLIGGSLAKAYKAAGHTVYGYDTDEAILGFSMLSGVVDQKIDAATVKACDALFIAVNPGGALLYMEEMAPAFSQKTLVMDCCGIKRAICAPCFQLAARYGFTFVGGHPMAGSHHAGYKNSRDSLFRGASMILVPPVYDDAVLYGRIKDILAPLGFGRLTFTTADKHDEMIAFSSQMAHVVSNAYIKSPTARGHKGFSAGSYKDLTRVARLNADMWAELCMENRDHLLYELNQFIRAVDQYKNALASNDPRALKALLDEGSHIKSELDK